MDYTNLLTRVLTALEDESGLLPSLSDAHLSVVRELLSYYVVEARHCCQVCQRLSTK